MRGIAGHRRWFVSIAFVMILIASLVPVQAQDATDAAATHQGDPGRTGIQPGYGPDFSGPIVERWVIDIDVPDDLEFRADTAPSSMAISDGIAYFGAIDGTIRAIDPLTGEELWQAGSGVPKVGTPAIAGDLLFIFDIGNTLHAAETADGTARWSVTFGESYSGIPNNGYQSVPSPAVVDGVVFIAALDGVVYALDAETGEQLWSNIVDGDIYTPVAVDDGRVFVTSGWPQRLIRAIDAGTGETLWEASNDNQGGVDTMIAADGRLHVQHFWGVVTFDAATGEVLSEGFGEGPSLGVAPVLWNSTVVLGTGQHIYAIDAADRSLRWQLEMTTWNQFNSPFVAADGVLYCRFGNSIYAVDLEAGELIGEVPIGYTTFGVSPMTVYEGLLIGRSGDGQFMALGGPSEAMLAETAEAEAAAETATAEAMQTATAIANIEATATAEAAITATAAAEIRATEQAYEAQWESYAATIGDAVTASPDFPASMSLDSPRVQFSGEDQPDEPPVNAIYNVNISTNSEAVVMIGMFATEEDAAASFAQASDGSIRSGFQQESVDGLGDNAACFTLVADGESTASCFLVRGSTMIVAYAVINAEAREAVLLNAADLLKLFDEIEQATARP